MHDLKCEVVLTSVPLVRRQTNAKTVHSSVFVLKQNIHFLSNIKDSLAEATASCVEHELQRQ